MLKVKGEITLSDSAHFVFSEPTSRHSNLLGPLETYSKRSGSLDMPIGPWLSKIRTFFSMQHKALKVHEHEMSVKESGVDQTK